MKQSLKVRAGFTMRICGKVTGNPMPTIQWKKDNMPLPDKVYTEVSGSDCRLEVEKANRYDSGAYSCSIANQAGSKDITVNVCIQDTDDMLE